MFYVTVLDYYLCSSMYGALLCACPVSVVFIVYAYYIVLRTVGRLPPF